MVCGRVPFTGTSTADVMGAHVHLPPPPPRELAPGLPRELERLILRMLAKERAERPADMAAVGRILDRLHGGPRGYVQPAATAHGRTDRMAPETAPTVDAKPLARPGTESTLRATAVEVKRPSRAVGVKSPLLAAGGLATLAVAAWLGWQRWGRGAPAELRGDEGAAIAASAALAAVPAPQPQPESQPARAPASPAPEPTALPAPAPVRVDLRSTPAGAAILNGGVSLGVTPRVIELPRGAAAVELRLELAGFRPALLRVTPDRDQRFDERLLPARRPAGTRMGDGVYQPFK